MNHKKFFTEILRLGLAEIRFLSTQKESNKRINRLTNILHNIPRAILDDSDFDFILLRKQLSQYQKEYKDFQMDYQLLLDKLRS